MKQLQTHKKDLNHARIITVQGGDVIEQGEVLLKIEKFSFTSNNVTYGVAGDSIGYWKFFPALENSDSSWGCIPVWGFAKVVMSNHKSIKQNERIFGYFPPATTLIVKPEYVSPETFIDGSDHRKGLPRVYNNYVRINSEKNYDISMDDIRALLFPLHITAFCVCDALEERNYDGASQVIIISASSKTAIGLAQGLTDKNNRPKIVGLTSKHNVNFVKSLKCYDEVIAYDNLKNVNTEMSVMVDMSGNKLVLSSLQESLGDNMLKCLTVGMTHWDKSNTIEEAIAQAKLKERMEFFFAPTHIQRRYNDWGKEGYNERTTIFMNARAKQSLKWMTIKEISGLDNFIKTYKEIVSGNINPNEGIVVSI